MRVFVAGATGALGRALLPLLRDHDVVGMTRSRSELVRSLGAEPLCCDVYDREALFAAMARAEPDVVIDLLTDLAAWDYAANARIRRDGTPNLVDAAVAAGARGLVIESVDFPLSPSGTEALAAMEAVATASGLPVRIVRLAYLWGPHTGHDESPTGPGWLHVGAAADALLEATQQVLPRDDGEGWA
jgi:nucleoside-diphosphate-sugar epimerase